SMGLSILLMIHRRTTAAGVRLHLDDRPAKLNRLLTLTGTLDHFTAPAASGAEPSPGSSAEPPKTGGDADPAGSQDRTAPT
ncbi:STAS domain-containing protein, partial [Streptomyces sp. NPDC059900]